MSKPGSKQLHCDGCLPGRYAAKLGSSTCTLCEKGKYQEHRGAWNCSLCHAGSYQDTAGQTGCKDAEVHYYTDKDGAPEQTHCAFYSYQDDTGRRECDGCASFGVMFGLLRFGPCGGYIALMVLLLLFGGPPVVFFLHKNQLVCFAVGDSDANTVNAVTKNMEEDKPGTFTNPMNDERASSDADEKDEDEDGSDEKETRKPRVDYEDSRVTTGYDMSD